MLLMSDFFLTQKSTASNKLATYITERAIKTFNHIPPQTYIQICTVDRSQGD